MMTTITNLLAQHCIILTWFLLALQCQKDVTNWHDTIFFSPIDDLPFYTYLTGLHPTHLTPLQSVLPSHP